MTVQVIFPRNKIVDARAMDKAIKNTLQGAALAALADFRTTTQTWEHEVEFKISKDDPYTRIVQTDDEIFGYVNNGTPRHDIRPRFKKALAFFSTPYKAKTSIRVIGSKAGTRHSDSEKPDVMVKFVDHPGTKAREFDKVIQEKWDKRLPEILQRAIDATSAGGSNG